MKKFYQLTFFIACLLVANSITAQRYVLIEPSTDPAVIADIFPIIMGDTTATGERMDENTIYQLRNGAVYITTGRIVNKPNWTLHIEAEDLTNTDTKPIITRIPNASGSYPDIMRAEGNVTLKNIWIISGQKGPGENDDWGKIRFMGDNTRIIVQDCIIEKDRGGFLQMRGNMIKCYVDRCIFRNGGNRRMLEGNGRGIDARNTTMDTLIVRNTIIHNIVDRVFRSQGGTEPHNYIEFDHNTIFNVAGRHGCFQFGKVNTVKVTNNFIMNPMMLGTTPVLTDEQTQPDNAEHKIFTVDELNPNTNFTFASNNIFWTQDILDVINGIDSVKVPKIYSDLILQSLGNDGSGTYFQDPTTLNSVPVNITQYVIDLYANPASENMFDVTVEDVSLAGTGFDFGNLFDFATFDPCYPSSASSATADTKGGAIGAVAFCDGLDEGTEVVTPVDPVRYVDIAPSDDPAVIADIFPVIMGDTTTTGERVSNNTIYRLMNGRVYITTGRLVNKPEWPLQIEAFDLENTALKPILTRIPNASGSYPDIMRAEGDVTLKNIWIISGQKGPGENDDWGKIRFMGDNTRVIVKDCIIEKDRGGFLQMRGNMIKCYVDGCVFRNGGNRRMLEGNGRGIDARNTTMDTLIVRNTVIHNIIDRVFRSQGGTAPHNYIEFDQNTIFNVAGRHGCFQFGKVNTVKVTNNFIMNPMMLGTTPVLTDEQTQPDNEEHKIFTVDELNANTNFTFGGNNIFWTQDILDVLNGIDSVKIPKIYSDLILQSLGNDGTGTYIQDPTALNSVPVNITQYVIDLYADPTSENMFDVTVEDISLAGTGFDFGNLFDFATFDPCYEPTATSATAGTHGGAIGAVSFCAELSTSLFEYDYASTLNLTVRPNPMTYNASFDYNLSQSGQVRLSIHNIMGQELEVLVNGQQPSGFHTVNYNINQQLAKGIYVARLQTEEGQMSLKIMIK